jgi:hypothetical protein
MRLLTLLALLACGGALAVWAPAAIAVHVQCGDVITADTTLDSDVVCPRGWEANGITIAADEITLDLGGHAVRGGSVTELETSNGIATDGPRRGLAVQNGAVFGFSQGVSLEAWLSAVRDMHLEPTSIGVSIVGGDNLVRRTETYLSGFAPIHLRGDGFVVDRNVAWGGYDSCMIVRGDHPVVTRNLAGACYTGGIRIHGYTSGARVSRNRIVDAVGGLSVFGTGARVDRNTALRIHYSGIDVADPEAVVTHNRSHESVEGSGIEISSPGATVSRNRADRNAAYGIYAVPGVLDGGGNRAHANGIADCVNIRCR